MEEMIFAGHKEFLMLPPEGAHMMALAITCLIPGGEGSVTWSGEVLLLFHDGDKE